MLAAPPPRLALSHGQTPFLGPASHVAANGRQIELLSVEKSLADPVDWDGLEEGPLFAYHLHQHEYLRCTAFSPEERAGLIQDWIARHKAGVGWDPHPIALRLLCWGKLLLTPGALPGSAEFRGEVLSSMADQAATLVAGLEIRLQANHLLSNLLSIVWAGMFVEGAESDRWLGFAESFLDQLDAQVHPDGGHEERSPMYHTLLLENVLDLLNVCEGASSRAPDGLSDALRETASRMLDALAVWTHPDGEIALFADSAVGIAASPAAIVDYAERLGVRTGGGGRADAESVADEQETASPRSALLAQTGYVRLACAPFDLIASVAGPAPAHQPGHAHCDALSFELSVGGRRLITDTGLFEYLPGPRRDHARATASHSTLQMGGEEQAEVWAAHRMGGRPQVDLVAWDESGVVEATCRGWTRSAPLHRRRFTLDARGIEILDRVDAPGASVVSRLFFAPGWRVELSEGTALLRLKEAESFDVIPVIRIALPAALSWAVERAAYYPTFGREVEREVLVGAGVSPTDSVVQITVAST